MHARCQPMRKSSATGTRTRVARVRAEYPNQLDYSGGGDGGARQVRGQGGSKHASSKHWKLHDTEIS